MTRGPVRLDVAVSYAVSRTGLPAAVSFRRWIAAALESRIAALDGELPPIDRPVYVYGLARSGSTVLLEALAQVPGFATHRYADFPFLYTPWWWNALRARLPRPPAAPQERAHGDRVAVTRDSPEAFEEVFWQQAFPGRHDPAVDQVLEGDAHNAAFDAFYTLHLRKLLAARGARRYLAKANYHLTRLGYLHARFPDARFVVPLREPLSHVGSLLRQHRVQLRIGGGGTHTVLVTTTPAEREQIGKQIRTYRQAALMWCHQATVAVAPGGDPSFGLDMAPLLPVLLPLAAGGQDDLVALRQPREHLRLGVADHPGRDVDDPRAIEPQHGHLRSAALAADRRVRDREHVAQLVRDDRRLRGLAVAQPRVALAE